MICFCPRTVYETALPRNRSGNDPRQRVACVRRVARALDGSQVVWAVRGAPGELWRWCRARSPKDLDLWAPQGDSATIIATMVRCGGIPTCARGGIAGRRGVLSAMFMFLEEDGRPIGTLDISFGPPRSGVIELADELDHAQHVVRAAGIPCFTGAAVLTELVLRRCVRGKPEDATHIRYARRCWHALPEPEKARFMAALRARFRERAARCLQKALSSERPFPWHALRQHLLQGALQQRPMLLLEYALDKAAFDRRPRERTRYPGGSRPSGTIVAIVGTDGTGKSSLVSGLTTALRNFGLDAEPLYFGRVRSSSLMSDSVRARLERVFRATSIRDSSSSSAQLTVRQRALRRLASYVYVFDYATRLTFRVLPLWAKGTVIVLDRYVYDLRIMPHASKLASRLAELIAPRPRLLFFLDPEPAVILERRQERTLTEVLKQQDTLRETCTRIGAGTRYIRVDSNAPVNELTSQLVRAAIATAHRREVGAAAVLTALLDDVETHLSQHKCATVLARLPCHG